jgi:hypothetical protein
MDFDVLPSRCGAGGLRCRLVRTHTTTAGDERGAARAAVASNQPVARPKRKAAQFLFPPQHLLVAELMALDFSPFGVLQASGVKRRRQAIRCPCLLPMSSSNGLWKPLLTHGKYRGKSECRH